MKKKGRRRIKGESEKRRGKEDGKRKDEKKGRE